jgi:hypothetical protein
MIKSEMDLACGTHTGFLMGQNLKERDHLEELGESERIILKMHLEDKCGWG